jgi:tetratricopeptide (TPR) repeat protein
VVLHLGKAGLSDYGRIEVIYNGRQQYQEAKEALNLGLEQLGEKWELRAMLTRTFFLEGQYDRALEECEKMYLIDPLETYNHMYRGNTYYFMEDFQAAEEEYRKFLNSDKIEERTAGRRHLIALYKLQGCFDDVIEQAKLAKEDPQSNLDRDLIDVYISRGNWDEAYRACQEWNPGPKIKDIVKSHKTAFIKAKLNQWKEAQTTVDELNNRIRDTSKVYFINLRRRFVLDLQGRLEMERGNYSQAIDYLEQVKKLLPGLNDRYYAWQVDALARAYMESGELEKAREEYKLIASLKGGRYEWGDIYAKAFYMLGKIAEELGEKNEARRQYTRFLELWKDADPDLPELEDAKKRLEALK